MNKTDIHKILKKWGQDGRVLPESNDTLKSEILSRVRISPTSLRPKTQTGAPWLAFSFATLALVVLIGNTINPHENNTIAVLPTAPSSLPSISMDAAGMEMSARKDISAMYPSTTTTLGYNYQQGNLPINDNREFLKTFYNANIKTRDVVEATSKIGITVRGFGGRVDNSSSGDEHGYVSFAIPENKFEQFRQEIRKLAGKKLIIENINSENMLPEKQSLEEQRKQIEKIIADLKAGHGALMSNHTKATNLYSSRITILDQNTAQLQAEWQYATQERRTQITSTLSSLQQEKISVQSQIVSENRTYQNSLADKNNRIKNMEDSLAYVGKQDEDLAQNLATVNGSISLQKVNLWEVYDIYVPGPLLAWILVTLAIISYLKNRKVFF